MRYFLILLIFSSLLFGCTQSPTETDKLNQSLKELNQSLKELSCSNAELTCIVNFPKNYFTRDSVCHKLGRRSGCLLSHDEAKKVISTVSEECAIKIVMKNDNFDCTDFFKNGPKYK